uniref:Uncharacterized protein n=1 Tax=Parascaris univalens TaxID=6257 RepID=A0A915B8C5_PARUN
MLINDRCSSVIGDTKGMCFQTATLLNKRACISVIGVRNPLFNSSHLRSMRSPHEIRAEHGEQTISFMDLSENTPAYHYGLNSCKKDYSRKITAFNDTCKVFTRADELLFICCCYEEAPMTCQMRLQNGVLPRYVAMAAWEIRCLIDEGKESGNENDTLINVVRKMEKGEVVNHHYFDEEDVRNGLKKQLRRVCESTIYRHGKQVHFLHNDRRGAPPMLQNAPKCDLLYFEDRRLASFLHKPCFPTMPSNMMCPFEDNATEKSIEVMTCCCASSGFCNVDLFLKNRIWYRPNKNCRYNNDYQHLTNKFFIEDSVENHSCIVHFANDEVMKDLSGGESSRGQVLNVYPGAAIIPIDYSYATLSVGECDYIETKVNERYVATRKCNRAKKTIRATLESRYLPLKLFVCRCSTDSGGPKMNECDVELRKKIPQMEKAMYKKENTRHRSYCAVASSSSIHDFIKHITERRKQKFNRVSSVCFTRAVFDLKSQDARRFEAGIVTRKMANDNKMPLDHIAFLLLTRFATDEDRCIIDAANERTVEALCFCRKYTNDATLSCNSDDKEILLAIRVAVKRFSRRVKSQTHCFIDP